jgi:hypothetical protein
MTRQQVNDSRLILFARAEIVAFVCECADDNCHRSVVLSPYEFIARREDGESIVHWGHESDADAPMAGEREAGVVTGEAEALVPAGESPKPSLQ